MDNEKLDRWELKFALREIEKYKADGKKIVFTNGCFDIFHAGHVLLLARAKMLGDVLVVGINSDDSIRRLKSADRPIISQIERQIVIQFHKSVDYVLIFGEDTPRNLIKLIKPDILVKGGDWNEESIIGGDIVRSYGGVVKSIPFDLDRSTTSIINKIREG